MNFPLSCYSGGIRDLTPLLYVTIDSNERKKDNYLQGIETKKVLEEVRVERETFR